MRRASARSRPGGSTRTTRCSWRSLRRWGFASSSSCRGSKSSRGKRGSRRTEANQCLDGDRDPECGFALAHATATFAPGMQPCDLLWRCSTVVALLGEKHAVDGRVAVERGACLNPAGPAVSREQLFDSPLQALAAGYRSPCLAGSKAVLFLILAGRGAHRCAKRPDSTGGLIAMDFASER